MVLLRNAPEQSEMSRTTPERTACGRRFRCGRAPTVPGRVGPPFAAPPGGVDRIRRADPNDPPTNDARRSRPCPRSSPSLPSAVGRPPPSSVPGPGAVAVGRLPAMPADVTRARDRGRAARGPGPRRPRDQPRPQARAPVPSPAAGDRPGAGRRAPRRCHLRIRTRPSGRSVVAPPGFVNVRLADAALEEMLAAVLARPDDWGRVAVAEPRHVNVEFVSANPTGPLHIGNARGAFVGDLLCRVLEAGGHRVTREYYFNDFGSAGPQPRRVGARASDRASRAARGRLPRRVRGTTSPRSSRTTSGPRPRPRAPTPAWILGGWASERVRAGHRGQPGASRRPLRRLEERGLAPPRGLGRAGDRAAPGGAATSTSRTARSGSARPSSATTRTGSSCAPTASRRTSPPDIGYVVEKFSRGFDELIYIWGADHHGTVARVRNAAEAMGYDRERVRMLLDRLGALRARRRGGVDVQARRRVHHPRRAAGRGRRRRRALVLRRHARAPPGIDFDIELAKKQSNENPVYYVQYAHARIASILRKAAARGWRRRPASPALLARRPDAAPGPRDRCACPRSSRTPPRPRRRRASRPTRPSSRRTFHAYYRDARVVDPAEPERSARRLALALATQRTLARTARPAGDLRAREHVGRRPGSAGRRPSAPSLGGGPGMPQRHGRRPPPSWRSAPPGAATPGRWPSAPTTVPEPGSVHDTGAGTSCGHESPWPRRGTPSASVGVSQAVFTTATSAPAGPVR